MRSRVMFPVLMLVLLVFGLGTACSENNLSVETLNVGAYTDTGATLSGKLTDGHSTEVGFTFWQTDVYLQEQNPAVLTSGEAITGTETFYHDVGSLQPATSYSYRAWAKDSGGDKIFGDTVSFTTEAQSGSVILVTGATTNLTSTSVRLHGEVVSMGSASSVMVEIRVGTTSGSLGLTYPVVGIVQAPGQFSVDLTDLTPDTTYYYQAAGSSLNAVVSPGEEKSFKTLV